MMKKLRLWGLLIATASLFASCEKDITLDLPDPTPYLVVHGHIEPDSFAYVSLSRNSPYFEAVDLATVAGLLVNNATVIVSDGLVQDTLLPAFYFQHYTLFNYRGNKIKGEYGKQYSLKIITPDFELEALTTIPMPVPLDSLWTRSRADLIREVGQLQPTTRDEELVSLYFRYSDPPQPGNFVRAFTRRNSETLWSSAFSSIYADDLINGQSVDFVLQRGKEAYLFNDSLTFEEYGYFEKGDTIYTKWATIDRPHYTFWNTLSQSTGGSGNPFANPVVVATNIRGIKGKGLGIWGGYGTSLDTLIVPR